MKSLDEGSKPSDSKQAAVPSTDTQQFLHGLAAHHQSALQQVAALAKNAPQQARPYDFSKGQLNIGIPAYGGMLTEACFMSFLNFVLLAQQVGLRWRVYTMVNEALVTRARNNLMAKMMSDPNATHFMFIDGDIRFLPDSILSMMAYNKDVVGGLYPRKVYPIHYAVNFEANTRVDGDLFTVDTLATGFLMFKRKVYEDLIQALPQTKYKDDVGIGHEYEPFMYSIFDCYIDENGHYLSEDWAFCRRAKALGYDMWTHSKVLLNHVGQHEFVGSLEQLAPVK
jgi:hypothetical protein